MRTSKQLSVWDVYRARYETKIVIESARVTQRQNRWEEEESRLTPKEEYGTEKRWNEKLQQLVSTDV